MAAVKPINFFFRIPIKAIKATGIGHNISAIASPFSLFAETLGLLILKEQIILLDSGDKETADILSKVIIMRKETS